MTTMAHISNCVCRKMHHARRARRETVALCTSSRHQSTSHLLLSWGANDGAGLGTGRQPVELHKPGPVSLGDVKEVKMAVAGYAHSCVVTTDGKLFGCGINSNRQLGDLKSVAAEFQRINDLSDIVMAACGHSHTIAVNSQGTAFGLGSNFHGQLGLDDNLQSDVPQQLLLPDPVVQVACGMNHTLVVTDRDGKRTIHSAGWGADGQTGTGHYEDQRQFLPVPGADSLSNDVQVSSSVDTSLVLDKTSGQVYGFGNNEYAQLGQDPSNDRIATVTLLPELSASKFWAIAAAGSASYGVTQDNRILRVGLGHDGSQSLDWTDTGLALDEEITDISASNNAVVAVTASGRAFAMGAGLLGSHGLGSTPVPSWQEWQFPAQLHVQVSQVALGHDFGLAVARVTNRDAE
eukprot:TRINITY_DN7710_c0_g2_i2.p1 TRINITY_DN7710_c0_g2~~TRINITY_DN7710_c0_g2_i2.p1  ORF type:complete len:405 (+),score=62.84 TRINITY_DN7710_c0_g2_i2:127-1341(+)